MNYNRGNPGTRYLDLLSMYRQVHQKPLEWWQELVGRVAAHHPGVVWEFWFHVKTAS